MGNIDIGDKRESIGREACHIGKAVLLYQYGGIEIKKHLLVWSWLKIVGGLIVNMFFFVRIGKKERGVILLFPIVTPGTPTDILDVYNEDVNKIKYLN